MNNNRIKKVRLAKHKTQKDLANLLGVSEQAIAYYEKALREPPLNSWVKLADYLEVPVSYLQGISNINDKNAFKSYKQFIQAMKKIGLAITYKGIDIPNPQNQQTQHEMTNLIREKDFRSFFLACNAFISDDDVFINKDEARRYQKIANQYKPDEINEVNFNTGYFFRMILDAKSGDSKANIYYDKIKKILDDYLGIGPDTLPF